MHDDDIGTAIGLGFRRMFDFSGRFCRSEFWWFHSFLIVVFLFILWLMMYWEYDENSINGMMFLFILVSAIPSTSLTVRRMHDIGRSGFFVFFPIVVWFMAMVESDSNNMYGNPCKDSSFEIDNNRDVANEISAQQRLEAAERLRKPYQGKNIQDLERILSPNEISLKQRIEAEKSEKLEESKRIAQSKQFIESSQICGFCEFGNRPNATFCGGCGKPLGDIICTNCQFENPNIASFCEGCGQRLGAS